MFVRLTSANPSETFICNLAHVACIRGHDGRNSTIYFIDREEVEVLEEFHDMCVLMKRFNRIVIGMDELPQVFEGEVKP